YFGPPTFPAGKTLTKSDPASQAAITSVGVSAPAIINRPSAAASATVFALKPGLTKNCAPASRHLCACSGFNTVPAPTSNSLEDECLANSRMTSTAPGTVIVIPTIGIPPLLPASAAVRASAADDARTTGTIPT